jgi:hypothetical protein
LHGDVSSRNHDLVHPKKERILVKKAQLFKHFRTTAYIWVSLMLSAGVFTANADEPAMSPEQSGELYLPSDDAIADVETAINAARESNKLTLVVMGANWCHDSRGLASRLYQEPLKSLVEENYETVFVDVGFLEKGKDIINSLGPPVYYATPTVLIVDPVSRRLVNEKDRHRWADAFSISMEESVDYFQLMAQTDLTTLREEVIITDDLQTLLTEIDVFEQHQADRLYQAYAVLGPMLEAYKAGNKEAFSEEYWNSVRDFRYKVAHDVDALRAEARERVAAGENEIKLTYPEYPAFPWDKEGR